MRLFGLRGIVALVALAALSLGVLQGAGTAAAPSRAKAPIQQNNYYCGVDVPSAAVLGQVTFVRRGTEITVTAAITGQPNSTYYVALWTTTNNCGWGYQVGSFVTGASGRGRDTFTYEYTGSYTHFIGAVWSGSHGGNTPEVTLP